VGLNSLMACSSSLDDSSPSARHVFVFQRSQDTVVRAFVSYVSFNLSDDVFKGKKLFSPYNEENWSIEK
jgi:hypothetical protein